MKKSCVLFILLLTFSCKDTVKQTNKSHIEERETPVNSLASTNDFISDLDLSKVYNNQLSIDFIVLGIYGNEINEHYQMCKTKDLNLYSYDTIWNIDHLNESTESQEESRVAFLTQKNFHLMKTEQWEPETERFIIASYKPSNSEFEYHLGNGFAFDKTNEISDFNFDGFLDVKIKYTKLDYERAGYQTREIMNEMYFDYKDKVEKGELNKVVTFEEYEKEQWKLQHNFGFFGEGYITRYSKNGLLYFFTLD